MKHIAFDLDGVLVDTDELHKVAVNEAITAVVGRDKIITDDEHIKIFKGLPTKRKMFMLRQMGRIDGGQGEEIYELKQEKTVNAIQKVIHPQREKLELFEALKLLSYRIAVCSNCIRDSVNLLVASSGLGRFIDFTISNEEVSRPKPNPEMYLKAAYQFGIKPSELIVVEDGDAGKKAAMDAGSKLVSVEGPADVTLAKLLPRIIVETGGV